MFSNRKITGLLSYTHNFNFHTFVENVFFHKKELTLERTFIMFMFKMFSFLVLKF